MPNNLDALNDVQPHYWPYVGKLSNHELTDSLHSLRSEDAIESHKAG